MSTSERKRKWDQKNEDEDAAIKVQKTEEGASASGKSAADAAAAAAAIAAKIAAQFAGPSGSAISAAARDPHDGDFTHDIEINDLRNRYMLTKGATQQQIHTETGASVTTKGVWHPDKSKATEKDPPLYLHISANSAEMLNSAIKKVEELIAVDLGSLVDDRRREDRPRERRKWPEAKIEVNLESIRNFNVRAKVVGPQGLFVKYIQSETNTRVQIKGLGSGFYESETGRESDEPMHIHITGPDELMIERAKALTEDLLEVVRAEYEKAKVLMTQQQYELHAAQAQYAAYSGYGGYAPPPPADAPPPPPPSDQPPPPPPDANGVAATAEQPPLPGSDSYAQYWAAYGYDVNSEAFKQWQAQQQEQYAAYYAAQAAAGYPAATGDPSAANGAGTVNGATDPNGAPPAPPSEPTPPPPPPPS